MFAVFTNAPTSSERYSAIQFILDVGVQLLGWTIQKRK